MRSRLLLVMIVIAVAGVSIFLFVSYYSFNDAGAVGLKVSLSYTDVSQNQSIRVNLQAWNTLVFKNSPVVSNELMTLNLTSGPCGGLYPFGIAVYKGAYDLSNVSSATPLSLSEGPVPGCLLILLPGENGLGPLENITNHQDLTGYWTSGYTPAAGGGESPGVLHRFSPGVYTVISGDVWGKVEVTYFHVEAITAIQERAGPVDSFPAAWVSPCNTSAIGNVTTGVFLNLNGSSLDHVNLNQVYPQIINSSSFAYITVGHGWVVSEWTESESAYNASVGQVVVSFILTSGDKPSGFLFVYYDPASNTSYIPSETPTAATTCTT